MSDKSWDKGICGCFSGSWCLSCWCPCILYGKNKYHLAHPEDPEENNYDTFNNDCLIWCAVQGIVGAGWVVSWFGRTEIRERLRIKGNGCNDCLAACCCTCCALVQEEQELKLPSSKALLLGGTAPVYAQQQPMSYPQQGHPQQGQVQYPQQQGFQEQGYTQQPPQTYQQQPYQQQQQQQGFQKTG